MLFNSVTFLLFLGIVVCLYWILGRKARTPMLFISSLVFYGFWRWDFLGLMLFSTILDYFISLKLETTENQNKRKTLLMVSLVVNLGLLVVFKYLFFFTENINSVMSFLDANGRIVPLKLILPLGISFYTFQTISYTIDVYRKHLKPEKNFFLYGTFVTFFPQLVAGPILRASEVMLQLLNRPSFKISYIIEGSKRILYGLFLKVVLADNIAPLVDAGFAQSAASLTALDVAMLAFMFGFQIYFD
ncbi:MAG: alginate O-acetyltransferase complex protein AlgI, partial [bacterium]